MLVPVVLRPLGGFRRSAGMQTSFLSEWREVAAKAIYKCSETQDRANRAFKKECGMGRLIRLVFVLVVLGFIALVGYAYLVDMAPVGAEVKVPVVLHAD